MAELWDPEDISITCQSHVMTLQNRSFSRKAWFVEDVTFFLLLLEMLRYILKVETLHINLILMLFWYGFVLLCGTVQ